MSYTKSLAQSGLGTIISIQTVSSPPTFTVIGEVMKINLTGRKNDTEDVTNMQSTQKEFISTLPDPGEFSLEGNRVSNDAGQVALEAAFASRALTTFTVQLAKASYQSSVGDLYTFNALVTELDYPFEANKANKFSAKLKVSGAMVPTLGS